MQEHLDAADRARLWHAVDGYLRHFDADDWQAIGSVGAVLVGTATLVVNIFKRTNSRD